MEQENRFKCSGDCLKCTPIQRQYCASQFTYNTMRMVEDMQRIVVALQGSVDEIRVKVEAIQGNEATLFNPAKEDDLAGKPVSLPKDTPQSGDGGESRSPETNNH